MTWADLITILFTVSLTMVMKHLDTMPGYSCPKYCDIDHVHYPLNEEIEPLDKESNSEPLIAGNVK
jgi:hypothetical protein